MVRVAVLGCLHGALEDAYRTILMINSSAESSPLDSSAAAAKSKPAASSADVSAPSSASSKRPKKNMWFNPSSNVFYDI